MVILGGYFRPLFRLCATEVEAGLAERALLPARDTRPAGPARASAATRCCSAPPRWRSNRRSTTRWPVWRPACHDASLPPRGLVRQLRQIDLAREDHLERALGGPASRRHRCRALPSLRSGPPARWRPATRPSAVAGRLQDQVAQRDEVAAEHDRPRVEHRRSRTARPRPSQRPTAAMPARTSADSRAAPATATAVAVRRVRTPASRPRPAARAARPTPPSSRSVRSRRRAPGSPIGRWPTSPANPRAPRSSRPSSISAGADADGAGEVEQVVGVRGRRRDAARRARQQSASLLTRVAARPPERGVDPCRPGCAPGRRRGSAPRPRSGRRRRPGRARRRSRPSGRRPPAPRSTASSAAIAASAPRARRLRSRPAG